MVQLSRKLASELVEIAEEKRVGSPGRPQDDYIDLGLMQDEGGQYGVVLENDEWVSTKRLGRKLRGRPIAALGGKSFRVVTMQSPEDSKPHVYMVPDDKA